KVGDVPTVVFKLVDKNGAVVADLLSNSTLSGSVVVSGPNENPQRVYAAGTSSINIKTAGKLIYDANAQLYTYAFATGWPANAMLPINTSGGVPQPNVAGSYTMWLW